MDRSLWAPWRMAYIQHLNAQTAVASAGEGAGAGAGGGAGAATAASASTQLGDANFLAQYWAAPHRDREQGVIFRDSLGMVMLNRFPYANGHLLIALGEPRATLAEYSAEHRAHFWRLMDLGMALCQDACAPQGMNVGLNVGRAAGAGLPQHIHGHVVPRWAGDSNFMSVLGQVRIIPDALEQSWERYRSVLPAAVARTL